MPARPLRLALLSDSFAVCRLPLDSELQMWFLGDPFFALMRTDNQLTIVCDEKKVPNEVQHEAGWRALKIDAIFQFSEVGVLESMLKPLADAEVGIFALSTFETDYVLVKTGKLDGAIQALRQAGHQIDK